MKVYAQTSGVTLVRAFINRHRHVNKVGRYLPAKAGFADGDRAFKSRVANSANRISCRLAMHPRPDAIRVAVYPRGQKLRQQSFGLPVRPGSGGNELIRRDRSLLVPGKKDRQLETRRVCLRRDNSQHRAYVGAVNSPRQVDHVRQQLRIVGRRPAQLSKSLIGLAHSQKQISQLPARICVGWGQSHGLLKRSQSRLLIFVLVRRHTQQHPQVIIARTELDRALEFRHGPRVIIGPLQDAATRRVRLSVGR